MKAEYDFSKGDRGKFYNAEAEYVLPIHLEPDVRERLDLLAAANGVEVQSLVNEWLRATLKVIESLQPSVGK